MTGDLVPNTQWGDAIAKAIRSVAKTVDRISQSIIENPLAWFLAASLAMVEYESHQRGRDLDRVCELLGSHDASYGHPASPREEIDTICNSRQADDGDNTWDPDHQNVP
jgi:hypothetical protein